MVTKQLDTSHPFGPAVANLIQQFQELPGIGRKSAERLANHVLNCSSEEAQELADAILDVKSSVHPCQICFNLTQNETCEICSDPRRDQDVICVVEQPKDVTLIESSGAYRGLYHILQGRLSPLDGIGPEDLTMDALVKRVREGSIQEIMMATNPNTEGDGTALFLTNLLANETVNITRLARGIASGSVLEFANKEMLADAIRGRHQM